MAGYRWMYYQTGLPGWMRFGYSPGWIGRSPTGLPPAAEYLAQTGQMPQFTSWLQRAPAGVPATPLGMPVMPKEQEIALLEAQAKALEQQLELIKKRLEELRK
ncbi:MAG: DUF5320 domain-containing protein [Methanophagales archaeon]|nr:DUF5320 domain-containing protein [Methanophagales archaeon]